MFSLMCIGMYPTGAKNDRNSRKRKNLSKGIAANNG